MSFVCRRSSGGEVVHPSTGRSYLGSTSRVTGLVLDFEQNLTLTGGVRVWNSTTLLRCLGYLCLETR